LAALVTLLSAAMHAWKLMLLPLPLLLLLLS
jgi:hypothetical protein